MRHLFLCTVLLAATAMHAQQRNTVVLTGSTRNFNNQVEVQDMSEVGDLSLPDPQRFFVPDAEGRFYIKFPLTAPNYFRVGRNILYLSPGDSLQVFIDYKDPRLATFSGKHAAENEYLRGTPFPKGGSFLEAGKLVKGTIDSTVQVLEKAAEERAASLASYNNLDKEFRRLETARIKADLLNSFAMLETYATWKWKLSKDSAEAFRKTFPALIAPYMDRYNKNFIDPSLLKLVVYRDIVDGLVDKEKNATKAADQIKVWRHARDMASDIKTASDYASKTKWTATIARVPVQAYKAALEKTQAKVLALSNGDDARDFIAVNLQNQQSSLSSLKGKVIYVDLWATWCGPCMEEMPAFEKLKESYKGNPNIEFISLSIDDDAAAWKASVQKRNAQGQQWLIDRAKLQAYNIISIPRTIIVDKNFKIVDMSGPLPSAKTLPAKLDGLLK